MNCPNIVRYPLCKKRDTAWCLREASHKTNFSLKDMNNRDCKNRSIRLIYFVPMLKTPTRWSSSVQCVLTISPASETSLCTWLTVYLQLVPNPSYRFMYSSFCNASVMPSPSENINDNSGSFGTHKPEYHAAQAIENIL